MNDLKFVLWNCSGLRATANTTAHKMGFLDKELPNASFAIAVLVETHHKGEEDFPPLFSEYMVTHNLIHSPTPPNHSHSGIVIFIRKDLDLISHTVVTDGRIINFRFRDKAENIIYNCSAFYGPQFRKLGTKDFYDVFTPLFNSHSRTDNNIIIGDFNFVDNDLDKGQGMDPRDKKISSIWDEFKSKVSITDPFREQFPTTKRYSFHAKTGKSRIDRVYVSTPQAYNVRNISYTFYSQPNTHKLMTFKLEKPDEKGPGYWKLNASILSDRPYINLINDCLRKMNLKADLNPSEWWDMFLFNVRANTMWYTEQKKYRENYLKKSLVRELCYLESLPFKELPSHLRERLSYIQHQLKTFEQIEIDGHRIRTRNIPNFEKGDPDISFYSRLEKRFVKSTRIVSLKNDEGLSVNKSAELLDVAKSFYLKLYSASKTSPLSQKALLRNIKNTLTDTQKTNLDAPITLAELETAVNSLNKEKSPGINGLPAEFYQCFWPIIKDRYLQFVNHAFINSFPVTVNTSVTTLLYKERGDIERMEYYRPISLINTDIKIISKALTNRLKLVLPQIIHKSQSAVDGRRIDHTVHLLRDLIDLANKENLEAAFIFLDQEKAFDRVDHEFLYKTMNAFGIGNNFIQWVKQIYSTAVTRVKVNGFLSGPIPLMRGVRQGDPLSFLLYVLNIELFALQIRANKNIVGFTVGGEKIVSMHYADDATISITQNRCFKEVIKDISLYEEATGAKINYSKTEGLWCGAWRHRQDLPLGIKWTNENVFHLGVFVGNKEPALKTFEQFIPKIKNSLNFWKPFKLSALSKARVIEIFHASRLWYAARFYAIPGHQSEILQRAFLEYINHPHKQTLVNQRECMKLKRDGGIKLINIQCKSEASKIQWLLSLCIDPALSLHKALMERLVGVQKGGLTGTDLFFSTKNYCSRICEFNSPFYKEAITAMNSLDFTKKIEDRFEEKVFYNPIFLDKEDRVIAPNKVCLTKGIFTYQQLILEQGARNRGEKHEIGAVNILDQIHTKNFSDRDFSYLYVPTTTNCKIPIEKVTQKVLYEELIRTCVHVDHHSTLRWLTKLGPPVYLDWAKIWKQVHNRLCRNDTISQVWYQIHLNDLTTASYNNWFQADNPCPLCKSGIDDLFHIVLHCSFTKTLWRDIDYFLKKLSYTEVTDQEMAFGLEGNSPPILVRNWLTFLLRECIVQHEKMAFYNDLGEGNIIHLKHTYNARVVKEVCEAYELAKHDKQVETFYAFRNPGRVLFVDPNGGVHSGNIVRIFDM